MMKIGLTYDLREDYLALGLGEEETAEFDKPDTIEGIEEALAGLGYRTERIGNLDRLVLRLGRGERWDMVFNIAEGLRGFAREAQIPALLEAYDIPYTFSDPLVLALTLHKGMTKRVIRDLGIPTPDFCMVEAQEDLEGVHLPYPLFAKPVAEGTGKGISPASKIEGEKELVSVCSGLLKAYRQPVLVERFLPGREFTVALVGTGKHAEALGVMEIFLGEEAEPEAYSYQNKERFEGRVEYAVVKDAVAEKAREVALAAWRGLGCRDGGRVDLRADADGVPNFMEVNPLAGLNPKHSDLPILCRLVGLSYAGLIERIMQSALLRVEGMVQSEAGRRVSSG
jgi:D-alanine-D-alanine ligase